MKKTALDKIVAYLKSRKTAATAPEIAKYAKVNYNTVRRILGELGNSFALNYDYGSKVCKVTKKHLSTYKLA